MTTKEDLDLKLEDIVKSIVKDLHNGKECIFNVGMSLDDKGDDGVALNGDVAGMPTHLAYMLGVSIANNPPLTQIMIDALLLSFALRGGIRDVKPETLAILNSMIEDVQASHIEKLLNDLEVVNDDESITKPDEDEGL